MGIGITVALLTEIQTIDGGQTDALHWEGKYKNVRVRLSYPDKTGLGKFKLV